MNKPSLSAGPRHVYFHEFNVLMPGAAYLPLVSGLLRASAESDPAMRLAYRFMPFVFLRRPLDELLNAYESPAVAAFSVSMWNEQFNLVLAAALKKRHPDVLIIFGGPQVPHHPEEYFATHPFIDVAVRGEGELTFRRVLARFQEYREFDGIPGVSWRRADGACIRNPEEVEPVEDIDDLPSPYLCGLYEPLFNEYPELAFQAIIETDRGCPFLCAYCYWGQGGLSRRFRRHSLGRIKEEIDWIASHRIRYVFNSASNFGMHPRDLEIAQLLVKAKEKSGFPEKFRSCYGKNAEESLFEIGSLLHAHRMEKGVTLSHQSLNPEVLANVRRKNIKMEVYRNLQGRFNAAGIPVYTELILGLPGETFRSWVDGVQTLFEAGLKNQLFIYHCQVYPNTELGAPCFQKRFGIVTRRIPLTETHGAIRDPNGISEFEEIIVSTTSMPIEDWRRATVFSWFTMVMTSLKLGFFVLIYLAHRHGVRHVDILLQMLSLATSGGMPVFAAEIAKYNRKIDRMLDGEEGHATSVDDLGGMYWDEEEASLLRILERRVEFYAEFKKATCEFLKACGIHYNAEELDEVFAYQEMRIPCWNGISVRQFFHYNLPEFFDAIWKGRDAKLSAYPQWMEPTFHRDFKGDHELFAKEILLWGRKSDLILETVSYGNIS